MDKPQMGSSVVRESPADALHFSQPASVPCGHKGLPVDVAAGGIGPRVGGRWQVGFRVIFLAAAGDQHRGQGQTNKSFHRGKAIKRIRALVTAGLKQSWAIR